MKRYLILKCRRCTFVTISLSWVPWGIWYSFWLLMLVSSPWPHSVSHPGCVNSESGQEICKTHTPLYLQPVLTAECFLVTEIFSFRDMHTQNPGALGMHELGKHSQKSDWKLVFFSLFVDREWAQRMGAGMASGKGSSKGEASLGRPGVSAQGENQGLAVQGQGSDTH